MSKVYKINSKAQRYDEASLWLAKLDRGLTAEEEREIQLWMHRHPANRELLLRMAGMWDKMDALSRLSGLFPKRRRHKRLGPLLAVAASVLLAIVLGSNALIGSGVLLDSPSAVVLVDDHYQTAIGERSNVSLPDGTRLILNTDTDIRVKYTGAHRVFMLERGEIHIDVAHDKNRPLSVFVQGEVVQAVGTAFSLRINRDRRVKLLVTDGKVLVAPGAEADALIDQLKPAKITRPSLAVAKGEAVMLGSDKTKIEKVAKADIEASLSWRQGNLIFRGEPLSDAVEEISRYSAVNFQFADESLRDVLIAGMFKAGDINGLLTTLERNFGISYSRLADGEILLSQNETGKSVDYP